MKYFECTSRSKTMPFAYLVSHRCFSAAHIAKISLLVLRVASLGNYLVLNARCNFAV